MTEKEIRNLQTYIGKRNQGQTDEQVIEYINKIDRTDSLTQDEWKKLIFPCCNNGYVDILKFILGKIDLLDNTLEYMEHTVNGRNEHLTTKRIEVLKIFMDFLTDNQITELSETMLSAAWFGETDIVKFLIANGADKTYRNVNGLGLEKCAERTEKQFGDSSLKEFLAE